MTAVMAKNLRGERVIELFALSCRVAFQYLCAMRASPPSFFCDEGKQAHSTSIGGLVVGGIVLLAA